MPLLLDGILGSDRNLGSETQLKEVARALDSTPLGTLPCCSLPSLLPRHHKVGTVIHHKLPGTIIPPHQDPGTTEPNDYGQNLNAKINLSLFAITSSCILSQQKKANIVRNSLSPTAYKVLDCFFNRSEPVIAMSSRRLQTWVVYLSCSFVTGTKSRVPRNSHDRNF